MALSPLEAPRHNYGEGLAPSHFVILRTNHGLKATADIKISHGGGAAVSGRHISWRAGTPAPLHGGPPHRVLFI